MPGTGRLLRVLAVCGVASVTVGLAHAAVPEWNTVRTHSVQIGPEAGRLVVGFRATDSNSVVQAIKHRTQAQSIQFVQANTSDADVAGLAQRAGLAMARSRQITPSMHVVFLGKALYGGDVNVALKKLRADPAVEFAVVDQRRYPHAMLPDDPLFATPNSTPGATGQWYMQTPSSAPVILGGTSTMDLSATDAVSAWSITTGSTGTIIADVDTGVRFDHPDLLRAGFGGRLLPGYDFVDQDYSRTTPYSALGTFLIANDGDGWDPDPSDPGDWVSSDDLKNPLFPPTDCADPQNNNGPTDSSWHGTRVMGVLGALTNNGIGIAGMTWNPYLLPVRALGKCGGYDSDIIAGIEWAAGMTVTDPSGKPVPANPYPADIINLSLGGGTDSCAGSNGAAYKSALTTVTSIGVLVVISAGNANGPVELPANCGAVVPGIIAVVGLRNVGTKVGYSSFGAAAGIAAPAGNCVVSSGGCYRSIDTTYNTGLTFPASNSYTDQINPNLGTSFSAPIVSGIAALMRAVNANLTPAQLITRIEASASPFPPNTTGLPVCPAATTTGECACVTGQCGAGMVNALSAVNAALNPIAVITTVVSNTTFDASHSVAACIPTVTIKNYAWTTGPGVTIQGPNNAAQVTVAPSGSAGTLTLTVTDSAGHVDTGTVSFTSGVATVNAPSSAGTAASACPTPRTITPVPPTITEAFSPTSVGVNVASTLTITFNNTNGFALTQSNFTETVPAGLSVQTSPAPTTTCGGASETLTSSAGAVTLTGANIPSNGSCSITLSVKSTTAGSYTDAIAANALATGPAGGNSASAASASLTVTAPSKSGGGGGALDWLDMMFVVGVVLAGRRHVRRPPQ